MKYDSKLFSIFLTSTAILMLVNIAGAAPYAYITNNGSDNVSVIDTITDTVTATVLVGSGPCGVSVNPAGTKVYIANYNSSDISVINTSTNIVTSTISVGNSPMGVSINPSGSKLYVANSGSNNVSVIDAVNNTVVTTVPVGSTPFGVAVSPDGNRVYVANFGANNISVIDTTTDAVTATVDVGIKPVEVSVNPAGTKLYVTNAGSNSVSVINTTTNTITATIPVGKRVGAIVVSPDGTKAYVTNTLDDSVSVIDTTTDTVIVTVSVGVHPTGISINPAGTKVYVVNYVSNTVSVIDTATNNVTSTVSVGDTPYGFGQFISPEPSLPVASFSSNVTSGYVPLLVQFNDSSKNATSWSWDFGDGTNSTEQNPMHTFSSVGNYTVNLTASNEIGTNSTLTSINVSEESIPAYSLYKSVIEVDNGGDCIVDDAGDIIRYRIVVKNEGNVDLTNVTVNDTLTSLNGPTGDDVGPGILNVGEIWKFYGNYTVTQADLNTNGGGDGNIDNTASVSCSELPYKSVSISQPISQSAYLRIYKSAIGVDNAGDNIANEAGDIIEYQIAVKNAGKVDLTGVSVSDPMISLVGPIESKYDDGVLTVGELWVYNGNYTVTREDLNANGGGDEDIDNTATVSCNELTNASSSIEVPLVITRTIGGGTDSESNTTTNDTSGDNDSDSDDNTDGSSGSNSSVDSHGGSGTGSAHIISNKNSEVSETPKDENGKNVKSESNSGDGEVTSQNEVTYEPQTENESTGTRKSAPDFEIISGLSGLLFICLYKRK